MALTGSLSRPFSQENDMTKHICVPASVVALLALRIPENMFLFAEDAVVAANRQRQMELMDSSTSILARAEAESRDLTSQERNEVEGLTNEFDELEAQIALRERVSAQNAVLSAPRARATEPDPVDGDVIHPEGNRPQNASSRQPQARVPAAPRATAGGTAGFRHLGEFANAVRMASMRSVRRAGSASPQCRGFSTYGNEGAGADGGFAVPPDFRTEILTPVFNEDSLLAMTDRLQSSSNTLTLPTDTTTPVADVRRHSVLLDGRRCVEDAEQAGFG
jgi:HK97 family phage major capsid protein